MPICSSLLWVTQSMLSLCAWAPKDGGYLQGKKDCDREKNTFFYWCILPRDVRTLTCLPTNGFSTKPLKVKLLAGEQKATE